MPSLARTDRVVAYGMLRTAGAAEVFSMAGERHRLIGPVFDETITRTLIISSSKLRSA